MRSIKRLIVTVCMGIALFLAGGCSTEKPTSVAMTTSMSAAKDEVALEREKLSQEDRALVDAQDYCIVSNEERLGGMGPPIKLDIKGQAVFICCKGCKRKAESDPDRTLAKLQEMKSRKKS